MGEKNSKIARFDDFGRHSSNQKTKSNPKDKYLNERRQGMNSRFKNQNFNFRNNQDPNYAFSSQGGAMSPAERYDYDVKRMDIDKSLKFCNNFLKSMTDVKNNIGLNQITNMVDRKEQE